LEELEAIGIKDGIMMVSERIIKPLLKAQQILHKYGYSIVIKDGYRSPEIYDLAYKKRVLKNKTLFTNK
jgi:hypothetical protein